MLGQKVGKQSAHLDLLALSKTKKSQIKQTRI